MVSCHDIKKGQVLFCKECGIEMKVISECKECGEEAKECSCEEHCSFSCCGVEMGIRDA